VAAAVVTIALVAGFARLHGSGRASQVAAVALASNTLFMDWARKAMVDMMLTCFLTAGFTAYFAARLGRLRPWRAAVLCGSAFGLAVLTKGPVGLALPVAVVAGDALIASRGRFWRLPVPRAAVLFAVVLTVALPLLWYVPGLRAGGAEFLNTCLLGENFRMPLGLERTADTTIIVSHKKALSYYFGRQAAALLPMLPLLPAAVRFAIDRASGPVRAHLCAWAGFGFLFFLAAANKRQYYLLPLEPAFALAIGLAADRICPAGRLEDTALPGADGEARQCGFAWAAWVMGGILVVASLAGAAATSAGWLAARLPEIAEPLRDYTPTILVFCVLGLALAAWFLRVARRRTSLVPPTLALALLTMAGRSVLETGLRERLDGMRPFVAEMRAAIPEGLEPVVLPPLHSIALDFYWPERLVHDTAAAASARYVFAQRPYLGKIAGPYEVCGTRSNGSSDHDIFLVRRQ
jgi:4-amino-4-deoxy-L-arabinose transferase-like glycosyltransferase